MPHAFVHTPLSLPEIVQRLNESTEQIGDVRIKIRRGLLAVGERAALLPCLVIEPFHQQWFYVQIRPKGGGTFLLRIDPLTPAIRTVGVRLAIAWVAQKIAGLHAQGRTETTNLADFLPVLVATPEEQKRLLAALRKKIARQMRAAELRQQAKRYILSLDSLTPPLRWEDLFGNSNPVEIEIGPGKGKFLIGAASTHPDRNFLGIEWAGRYLKILSERIPRYNLSNVRLLSADAREIFRCWIPPDSVHKVHIYYPDPWWKRRHAKYKLFSPEFLSDLQRILVPGGTFHFATDVPRVYEEVNALVAQATQLEKIHEKVYRAGQDKPPGRSNFEIKKWESGSDIFEATWKKRDNP